MFFLLKVFVSALVIAGVSQLAKSLPAVGGIIAALPLVSLLTLFWLKVQGTDKISLSQFVFGVTKGLPSTICMLAVIAFLLKKHSLIYSVGYGFGAWGFFLILQNYLLKLMFS